MKIQKRSVSGVFVFLLLGMFAVVSVMMVLLSASAYRSTVERIDLNNSTRVLNAFVRSALMADDEAGLVEAREEKGLQTLCILADEGSTIKRLYCLDGTLRELYTFTENEFKPDSGEIVCDAQDLRIDSADGLLTIILTDALGRESYVRIALRTAQNGL